MDTKAKVLTKDKEEIILAATYQQKSCSKYNYVIINNTTYATTVTTTYTTVSTSGGNGWTKVGSGSYDNPPRDTATTHLLVLIIHIVLKHVQLYQHIIMIHTNIQVEHFHKLLDQLQLQDLL